METNVMQQPDGESSASKSNVDDAMEIAVPFSYQFVRNLQRAASLAHISLPGADEQQQDILRAAVVFTHAALEELLRVVGENFLPHTSAAVLDQIPFAGKDWKPQASNVRLGILVQHKGKSADDVILESVHRYLQAKSFNHPGAIREFLGYLGISFSAEEDNLAKLAPLIERRHQIAHNADCVGSLIPKPINSDVVLGWIDETLRFGTTLVARIIEKAFEKRGPWAGGRSKLTYTDTAGVVHEVLIRRSLGCISTDT